MLKYNDFIQANTSFGLVIAKFLCYRPDKNTVVIDHENRLHEIKNNDVRKLLFHEVNEYFDNKIKLQKNKEAHFTNTIKTVIEIIKSEKITIKNLHPLLNKLKDKVEAHKLIIVLWQSSNGGSILKQDADELAILTLTLNEKKKQLRYSEKFLNDRIKVLHNLLEQRKKQRQITFSWKLKKEQWLGGLTNENRY